MKTILNLLSFLFLHALMQLNVVCVFFRSLLCVFMELKAVLFLYIYRLAFCKLFFFRQKEFFLLSISFVKSIMERCKEKKKKVCLDNCVMKCLISIRVRSRVISKGFWLPINHVEGGWAGGWSHYKKRPKKSKSLKKKCKLCLYQRTIFMFWSTWNIFFTLVHSLNARLVVCFNPRKKML